MSEIVITRPAVTVQLSRPVATVTITIPAGSFVPANEGTTPLFVQPDRPTHNGPYYWWQTGLGVDQTGETLWIEDGQP